MTLFHVAPIPLGVGSVIEPGNFGRIIQYHPAGSFLAHREAIYELVRTNEFPDKPSRLSCIFLLPTEEEAITYQQSIAIKDIAYEIEVLQRHSKAHVTYVDLVCGIPDHQIPASQLYASARAYWQSPDWIERPAESKAVTDALPTMRASIDVSRPREILIQSPIRIVRRLDT